MRSYSVDFRTCVLRNIDEGLPRLDVLRLFNISPATLTIWQRKRRETGDISPMKRGRYKTRKLDDTALISYIENNNDSTLAEIAEHFGVSTPAIIKRCKLLGITRKKNHTVRRAGRGKKKNISG
jgi:transposase